jgi:anthranilate/para-aminobenzoate synthase component II
VEPVHGRTSLIHHAGTKLFAGLPTPLRATRYHSLIVDETSLPKELIVTARTDDGAPMALEHATWPVFGVQFHPESVLTQHGRPLLANFLKLAGIAHHSADVPPDWNEPAESRDSEGPLVAW